MRLRGLEFLTGFRFMRPDHVPTGFIPFRVGIGAKAFPWSEYFAQVITDSAKFESCVGAAGESRSQRESAFFECARDQRHFLAGVAGRLARPNTCVRKIGRAHVCTPVTNAHLVCRLLLEKKNTTK